MALYHPCELWTEITDQKQVESTILSQNKRHLYQASVENSRVHGPIMQKLLKNHGTNDLVDQYLQGDISMDYAVYEAIQA